MDNNKNWLDYDVDEVVRGDRDYLWHHIKPHKVFQTAEQMIIVEGKGLRVKDIRGRGISRCHFRRCLERHGGPWPREYCSRSL